MVESGAPSFPQPFPAHTIEVAPRPPERPVRNSVGGRPFLDEGQEWPECFCGERLTLFFQLALPPDLGPFGGDHLLLFHCRVHEDATIPEPTDDGRLVPRYWDAPSEGYPAPFWRVLLQRRAVRPSKEAEPLLLTRELVLRPFSDVPDTRGKGAQTFKVGGTPSWAQNPEHYQCACGADLVYVCQVPEDMRFAARSGAPERPEGVADDFHTLFLGNEVYLLACPEHCDPAAVWPVNQN